MRGALRNRRNLHGIPGNERRRAEWRYRLWARMEFPVNVPQPTSGYVGIDFCCADAGMAEQFLDYAQVRAVLKQVRGEAVAQHVGRHFARDARPAGAAHDAQPKGVGGKWGSPLGQKDVGRRAGGNEVRPPGVEVTVQGIHRLAADGARAGARDAGARGRLFRELGRARSAGP